MKFSHFMSYTHDFPGQSFDILCIKNIFSFQTILLYRIYIFNSLSHTIETFLEKTSTRYKKKKNKLFRLHVETLLSMMIINEN